MKNNKENIDPLSRKTILLINISLVLISILFIGSVVSVIRYKKQKAEQQKVLLLQQQEVLESLKTSFPDYRNSQDYKEKQEMAIAKISIDEVQEGGAEIKPTGGFYFSESGCLGDVMVTIDTVDRWSIMRNSSLIASNTSKAGYEVAAPAIGTHMATCDPELSDLYVVLEDLVATVELPTNAPAGTYTLQIDYVPPFGAGDAIYEATFKITPPCPAGVELTITPQG